MKGGFYYVWLRDCVENRKWSWPQIASCLVHWTKQKNMTRSELLAKLKLDYHLASAATASTTGEKNECD